jgi:hypothetical protein
LPIYYCLKTLTEVEHGQCRNTGFRISWHGNY